MSQHSPIPDAAGFDAGIPHARPELHALTLDWDAYFDAFKEAHGEPVRWRGQLLFPDGWRYDGRDKTGEQYPPPTDTAQLHELQTCYWLSRLRLVRAERDWLREMVKGLRALERARGMPLWRRGAVFDETTGKYANRAERIDLDEWENGRLAWLEQDVLDCEERLRHLLRGRHDAP